MTEKTFHERVHAYCNHWRYGLTCEQIDQVRADAQERCQICGKHERYAGLLNMDHDKTLGFWAFRGILCTPCNLGLERGRVVGPEVDAYLANAWYKRLPGAGEVRPEDEGACPRISKAEALAAVTAAADMYRKTYGQRERPLLIDACRAAKRVGCTRREIAHATRGVWREGHVGYICAERRKQPSNAPHAAVVGPLTNVVGPVTVLS